MDSGTAVKDGLKKTKKSQTATVESGKAAKDGSKKSKKSQTAQDEVQEADVVEPTPRQLAARKAAQTRAANAAKRAEKSGARA